MRTRSSAFCTSWCVNPVGTAYAAGSGLATGATCSRLTEVDRVVGGVRGVLLEPDPAARRDGLTQHDVGLVVDVTRRARAGRVAGRRLVAVQPGVLRGERQRLLHDAVDVHVDRRVDAAAARRVPGMRAGHQGIGLGLRGELDVLTGGVEVHGLAADASPAMSPMVGWADHLGAAADGAVLRLVHVVRHVGAAPDEQRLCGCCSPA